MQHHEVEREITNCETGKKEETEKRKKYYVSDYSSSFSACLPTHLVCVWLVWLSALSQISCLVSPSVYS